MVAYCLVVEMKNRLEELFMNSTIKTTYTNTERDIEQL